LAGRSDAEVLFLAGFQGDLLGLGNQHLVGQYRQLHDLAIGMFPACSDDLDLHAWVSLRYLELPGYRLVVVLFYAEVGRDVAQHELFADIGIVDRIDDLDLGITLLWLAAKVLYLSDDLDLVRFAEVPRQVRTYHQLLLGLGIELFGTHLEVLAMGKEQELPLGKGLGTVKLETDVAIFVGVQVRVEEGRFLKVLACLDLREVYSLFLIL